LKASAAKGFPSKILAAFEATKYMPIRSGNHRYIPIWSLLSTDAWWSVPGTTNRMAGIAHFLRNRWGTSALMNMKFLFVPFQSAAHGSMTVLMKRSR